MKTSIETINKYLEIPELKEALINVFSNKEFICERIKIAKSTNDFLVINELSNDENLFVCVSVVENPYTPISILEKLSQDKEWIIRMNIAENPSTPAYILEKLSQDKNDYVCNFAKTNLKSRR